MKSLQQLKTDLEIYQEGYAEAETQKAREHYHNLYVETSAKIANFKPSVTKNWFPVIGSLLTKLQRASFTLVAVEDGGDLTKLEGTKREQRQQAKALICAVGEAHLYVDNSEGIRRWLYIVLGNEPEETLADYSSDPELDAVVEEFSEQWAGKPCPTN